MKNYLSMLLIVAMATAAASPLWARGNNPDKESREASPAPYGQLSPGGQGPAQQSPSVQTGTQMLATIAEVDVPTSEVVIEAPGGGQWTEKVTGAVVISDGEHEIALTDLKPGDSVNVEMDSRGELVSLTLIDADENRQG